VRKLITSELYPRAINHCWGLCYTAMRAQNPRWHYITTRVCVSHRGAHRIHLIRRQATITGEVRTVLETPANLGSIDVWVRRHFIFLPVFTQTAPADRDFFTQHGRQFQASLRSDESQCVESQERRPEVYICWRESLHGQVSCWHVRIPSRVPLAAGGHVKHPDHTQRKVRTSRFLLLDVFLITPCAGPCARPTPSCVLPNLRPFFLADHTTTFAQPRSTLRASGASSSTSQT
jgi:hypothetical protein